VEDVHHGEIVADQAQQQLSKKEERRDAQEDTRMLNAACSDDPQCCALHRPESAQP
jgi:hypothetical protein